MITTVNEDGTILGEAAHPTSHQVVEFNPVEQGLSDLRQLIGQADYDITTSAGEKTARELRKLCVDLRGATDDVYETLNRPMLDRQSAIRGLKKHITEQVLLLEAPLNAAIKAQEAAKEAERALLAAAKELRLKGLRAAIQAIAGLPVEAVRLDAKGIAALDHALASQLIDETTFAEFTEEALSLRAYIRTQLGELFQAAMAREAEAERVRLAGIEAKAAQAHATAEALVTSQVQAIAARPLQAIGRTSAQIEVLIRDLVAVVHDVLGGDDRLAQAYQAALAQLKEIQAGQARLELADKLRQQEADAAVLRQQAIDKANTDRMQMLKQQQDAFELEKQQAELALAARELALKLERQAVAKLLEPIAVPVPVVVLASPVEKPAALAVAPVGLVSEFAHGRPSDLEFVMLLSISFEVDPDTVVDWLRGFDADAVAEQLTQEEGVTV